MRNWRRKENHIAKMCKDNQSVSLLRVVVGGVAGIHHTPVWHFVRDKLKLFRYGLQAGRQMSETNQDKLRCARSTIQGKVTKRIKIA